MVYVQYIWNGSNGNFDTATDWSPVGVPTSGNDFVSISSGTVQYTGSILSIQEIGLGSAASAATLDFLGGPAGYTLLNDVDISTSFGGSLTSAINVTGELEMTGTYDDQQFYIPQSLTMTLTPAGPSGLGIFVLDAGAILSADNTPIGLDSAAGTVSISPDTTSDTYKVAFVNDSEAGIYAGATLLLDVPVYAQAGQTGTLYDDGGTLALGASVVGQTVDIGGDGSLILDQPATFDAALAPTSQAINGYTDYAYAPPTLSSGLSIDLRGLAADQAAFVTTPQFVNDIELFDGNTIVDTLYLQQGVSGGLGVSLSSDGEGGTILRVDLSSDSTDMSFGNGDGALDPNALLLPGAHTDYTIVQGSNTATISSASLTDYSTLQATLCFSDGTELYNANTTAAAVNRLYEGLLGREADSGGLLYWSTINHESLGLSQIAAEIMNSAEFAAKAALSDTGFVEQLYANVLGRPADASGQTYWTNLLANGESRDAFAVAFTNTDEAVSDDASRLAHGVFLGS